MASKKAKGKRAKTRSKLRMRRRKIKSTVSRYFKVFDMGQRVQVNINPSVHSTLPDARYQGLVGEVTGKRGRAFEIRLKKGAAMKNLVLMPAHLKVMGEPKVRA